MGQGIWPIEAGETARRRLHAVGSRHWEKAVPRNSPAAFEGSNPTAGPLRALRVLVVDRGPQLSRMLTEAIGSDPFDLRHADSFEAARRQIESGPVDLALIDVDLLDGGAPQLAEELRRRSSITQTIVICGELNVQGAIEAIRAGAADLIARPLEVGELNERVRQAVDRHRSASKKRRRVRRLKKTCRKLNQLRCEVTQQVDVLCNDLVCAYQDLATQMHQAMQANEFASVLRRELDIEQLLRKTLEYLLTKAGPTNAAIFLTAGSDQFTLGGYINYDCATDAADMLLEHLADGLAPQISDHEEPLHITDNEALAAWFGADAAYLMDSHLVAFSCRHEDEVLAVVVMFRDMAQPYDESVLEAVVTIAPMLGDYLAKVIRIHHRHLDDPDDESWDLAM